MLENIITALGDNAELINEVKLMSESNHSNVTRIGKLEGDLNEAITKRQSVKDLVRTHLGLSEVSEDSLSSFAHNADEGLKMDNQTLQDKLAELQTSYDGLGETHEKEVSEMILKDTLRGLGIGDRVANDRAFSELTKLVLNGATREGAAFTFKEDGKTIFADGGKPMNVEDRINQLQGGEYSYLFKTVTGAGGGQNKDGMPPKQQTKLQSAISGTIASMRSY